MVSGSEEELIIDSSDNTSGTSNGTYNTPSSGSGSTTSGSTSKSTVKTPDTGEALDKADVALPLIGSIGAVLGVLIISRLIKRSQSKV